MATQQNASAQGDDLPPEKRRALRRAIAASAMGNATEWYDYGSYAYVAGYIGAAFFPSSHHVAQILSSFGVFAVSFAVRPFGGIVFGPLGDRLGRQRVLALTIIMMAGGTFLVGLLPGYATIGVAAPVLLVLLRLIQGFSTGGEYGGAATFMAEYATDRRRGFFGSWLEFGTLSGYILGAGITTIVSFSVGTDAMAAWGWRIPFLVAGPLGAVGLYLRLKLEDTPVFRELEASGEIKHQTRTQVREILRYWRPLLVCGGMVLMLNVADYTLLTYMPTYLKGPLGLTENTGLLLTIVVYAGMMAVITFAGRLSDRLGRKPLWYLSAIGFIVLSVPMFAIMPRGIGFTVIGFMVLGLLLVLQLGHISATFPAMFPTHIRYAGFAISYNIATSLFGGTAPLVNEAMVARLGTNLFPAYYMMAACAVGLVATLFMPETKGASLRGTEIPGITRQPTAAT